MLKKVATNTIAQIISKALSAIVSIFLINLLTNYLTVELYGVYSKVYNYIGIFVFLADLGLYAITIKEISSNKEDSAKIVGNVMSLRFILGFLILFLAVGIAFFIPGYNSKIVLISIFIASIFTILQLINSSILALMQANMKMEFSAFSLVFSKLINLGFIFIIIYFLFPKGLVETNGYFIPFIYIMCVGVFHVLVNTLLNYFYARKIVKFNFAWDFDYIKHIFKISLPYGIALFLSIFYFKLDVMLITIIEGPEKGDLSTALYSVPMKIVEVLMVIGGFYMTSILPSLSESFKNVKRNLVKLNSLIFLSFKVLFAFASMVVTLGILFRENIILMVANERYINTNHIYNSSDAFLLVFGVLLFYFLSLVFIYSFVASNNQSKLLKINIIVTIFNFIGNIILIPKYSFIGAGIVTVLSQVLLFALGYFNLKKVLSFKLPIKFIMKNLFFGVLIFFVGNFILINYSKGIYFDFFIYGGILFLFFIIYYFFEFKKELKQKFD